MNASQVLARAVATLKASPAIDHWQKDREEIEADDLLCHALDVDEVEPDDIVPAGVRRRFERMVERRATGEPVQLIKGFAVFRGLEILARPGVFVPRDSTEFLAEQAIRRLRRQRRNRRQRHSPPTQHAMTACWNIVFALSRSKSNFSGHFCRKAFAASRETACFRRRLTSNFSSRPTRSNPSPMAVK